jgi:hypothetical protein
MVSTRIQPATIIRTRSDEITATYIAAAREAPVKPAKEPLEVAFSFPRRPFTLTAVDTVNPEPDEAPFVAAVAMGYGHLRAAMSLAEHWGVPLERADRSPLSTVGESLVWALARRGYHSLSRLSQDDSAVPFFGRLLDRITAIDNRRPTPSAAVPRSVTLLDALIRLRFGRRLGRRLDTDSRPLVATFYANALAAEHHSAASVACVVTDSYVHRVWVARDPASSRIVYLVPVGGTADCLAGYGVDRRRICVTGFPLPPGLVGSGRREVLERNLRDRRKRLGRFMAESEGALSSAPRLTVAVGGAGAQAGRARDLLRVLDPLLSAGRLRLTLVAGTHRWVARMFSEWVRQAVEQGLPPANVEILAEDRFIDYYRSMNRVLAETDILWTKPSELVFYAALGLPLILEQAVGDHERHNRELVVDHGVAVDRPPTGELAEWLHRRLATGWFAEAADRGRERLDAGGTVKIASFCSTELYGRFTAS